jgi:hypothetical protein
MGNDLVFFDELFKMFQFFEIASKDLMASQVGMKMFRVEAALIGLEVVFDDFPRVFLEIDDAVNKGERIEIDTTFAQIFVGLFSES